MKYLIALLFLLLLYSCSDTSNPSNSNNNNSNDVQVIYFDSVSYWGGISGSSFVSKTLSDTTIKNVRICFLGETDYDSTYIEAVVQTAWGAICDYKKFGKSEINKDHVFTLDVSTQKVYTYTFRVCMFYEGINHYVRMKFIKVFKI